MLLYALPTHPDCLQAGSAPPGSLPCCAVPLYCCFPLGKYCCKTPPCLQGFQMVNWSCMWNLADLEPACKQEAQML